MPCNCSGLRVNKCNCKILGVTGFQYKDNRTNDVTIVAHNKSVCCSGSSILSTRNGLLMRFIENLYEKCAAYNLRYCLFSGFVRNKNCLGNALKDFIILFCFCVANFIVFITILTRMTLQLSYVIMQSVQWMRRNLISKMDSKPREETLVTTELELPAMSLE